MDQNQYKFEANTEKIFNLFIESVYKDREVFLRELISNASDACEKLRQESNLGNASFASHADFKITVTIDKENKKLIIQDNGIGLNKEDMINNLGTIASSGTGKFLEEKLKNDKSDSNFIGQFGIGFYSAFLVSKDVIVESKKFDSEQAHSWESTGVSGFTINDIDFDTDADAKFKHGTRIILNIRDDAEEYLEKERVKYLIELYSKNIAFNIALKEIHLEVEEILNEEKALWTKDKKSITKEEYAKFFREMGGIYGEPWLTLHGNVEGESNYTYLLFVPEMKPFALFDPDRKTSLKLHVNKVFISEDVELLPKYLRFIKGVVDSYDLPLNVSREVVQKSHLITKMKQYLTKKVINELKAAAKNNIEGYKNSFWPNFGGVLKEGLCEALNTEQRDNILELCCFFTSKSPTELINLDEYIARMAENQKEIFYFNGESVDGIMRSPHMEGFIKRDIEVLCMLDGVDDFWVNVVLDYNEKKFKSITQEDIDLNSIKLIEETVNENPISDEQIDKLIDCFKEVLGGAVQAVVISKKLTDSPACLGLKEGQMNMKMERFLIDQKQLGERSHKSLEINKDHELIAKMNTILEESGLNDTLRDAINNLFDFVCIIEGEPLKDSNEFSKRANKIINNIL